VRKIVFLSFVPLFLHAYTLQELVELSHNNRLIDSSKHTVESAQSSYESIKSSYLPTLDIDASYAHASKESPAVSRDTIRGAASFKYTLYDGGKRGDLYSQRALKIDSSKSSLESAKNELSLDITKDYFNYLSLLSDKEATEAQINQLEAELDRLKNFYEVGSATKDELDKIDSRVKNAILSKHEIELELIKITHSLEYLTLKNDISIDSGSTIKEFSGEVKPRADIVSMKKDVESLMYEASASKSTNYPTIFFDDTISKTKYYFNDKSKESGFLIKNQNIASLNLSWNILDFGATTSEYESKYSAYLSQKSILEHEEHKASVDLKLAQESYSIALKKIDAASATLEASKETYELIKVKFENGAVDNVAYLEALSEVYDATKAYHRALNDAEIKKAEVIYFSGKDIKEFL
jgi:outer membrane protein TolC